MKRVVIEKGQTRLLYDPETRFVRLDRGGGGLTIELTPQEAVSLSKALWYSGRPLPE